MNDAAFTQWFAALVATDFHACMHGGERNKRTRLLASAGLYDELAADCDNSHPHKPWFVVQRGSGLEFATAQEAECPKVLANRMAACLRRQAERQQLQLGPRLSSAQKARHAWGVQTVKGQPSFRSSKTFVMLMQHKTNLDIDFWQLHYRGHNTQSCLQRMRNNTKANKRGSERPSSMASSGNLRSSLSRRNLSCTQRIPKKLCHKC